MVKENHVPPTAIRVENAVKQIILLPNVAVGKTTTRDTEIGIWKLSALSGIPERLYKNASKDYQLKHATCRLRRLKAESRGTSTYPSMAWQLQVSTGLQARSQQRNSSPNWQKGRVWV